MLIFILNPGVANSLKSEAWATCYCVKKNITPKISTETTTAHLSMSKFKANGLKSVESFDYM